MGRCRPAVHAELSVPGQAWAAVEVAATATAGDYLIEVAPTAAVGAVGSFELAVSLPSPRTVHSHVRSVGNTATAGNGLDLGQFLTARGSVAKSASTASSDLNDPRSPTHPWLAFTADWCSVPSQGTLIALEGFILAESGFDLDLSQCIVQEPDFGGVAVPFYYACLRHDFNWRNLHRVKHHLDYDASGVWDSTVRARADERFKADLLVLCNANQHGEPQVSTSLDWTLSGDWVPKCEEVAMAFKGGVASGPFSTISYVH